MEPRNGTPLDGASLSRLHDNYMKLRQIALAGVDDTVRAAHAEWVRVKTGADPMWAPHGPFIDFGADAELIGIAFQGTFFNDEDWMRICMDHFWAHIVAATDAKVRFADALARARAGRGK